MRICIIGCGAIGSLFAAHLAQLDGVEVWAVDPWVEHVAAIERRGLTVVGASNLTATIHARVSGEGVPPCEFGIVAVKAQATRAAMASAAPAIADAAVVSLQNGLGNEEVVAEVAPRVMRGSTLPAGAVVEPGVVRYDATGDTWIGPFEPRPATMPEVEHLAALLTRAGLPTHALADARGAQWTKVVFNAATNPVGALTGLSIGQLRDLASLRELVTGLVAEGRAVAGAIGVQLSEDPDEMIATAASHNFWHRASMLQDTAQRRPTEIAVLNAAIVAQGRAVGVPTPLNQAVVAMVEGLEASWRGHDDPLWSQPRPR